MAGLPRSAQGVKPVPAQRRRAAEVLRRLRLRHPAFRCELDFTTPLELAVAAMLSAQCTDKRVNQVTPDLFRRYRAARDWAETPQETLEAQIRSTGFFRNKARNIRALARALVDRFGGELPSDFDTLVGLPGIGRKTANLIVATVFGQPGIIVDTHCTRLSNRIGFSAHKDPVRIEFDLRALVPRADWTDWSHAMVLHGRYVCTARKPSCESCPLTDLCPWFQAQSPAPARRRTAS